MPRGNSNTMKKDRNNGFRCLVGALESIPQAAGMLCDCAIPSARTQFERLLTELVDKHALTVFAAKPAKNLFDELLVGTDANRTSETFVRAKQEYRTNVKAYRKVRRLAAGTFLLDREAGAAFVSSLPTIALARLATPYPPPGMHISESPEITAQWRKFCHEDPLPDARRKRSYIHELDPTRLQYVVGADESCKLVDKATNTLVAVVIRDLTALGDDTNDPLAFREWATHAIVDGIQGRRSIRVRGTALHVQTIFSTNSAA